MGKLRIGLWTQAAVYLLGGMNHFAHPAFYLQVMPDHYAHPAALVQLSGIAELLGGLGLLMPLTRRLAAVGIVAMLIIFCDVHVFMLLHPQRFPGIPHWLLWARLPLQLVLIAWAGWYARKPKAGASVLAEAR